MAGSFPSLDHDNNKHNIIIIFLSKIINFCNITKPNKPDVRWNYWKWQTKIVIAIPDKFVSYYGLVYPFS